jgi:hypothetical protein
LPQRGSAATEGLTADNTDGADINEQKQTKETKIVDSSQRNFLFFVIFCSALGYFQFDRKII